MTKDIKFSAGSCPLENPGKEWGEPGLTQTVARFRIPAQFSCAGNPCAGLIQKPLEAFSMSALAGYSRGFRHTV